MGNKGGDTVTAGKTPTRAHRFFLRVEGLSPARLRLLAAGLTAAAALFLVLMMLVLEHVPNPWLRAPLVLVTGGLMSAAGLALGAVAYELRYRQHRQGRSNPAGGADARAAS